MRSSVHSISQPVSQANQRFADAVDEHVAGQQAAARLIEENTQDVGHGDELAEALRAQKDRSDAYQKGFSRILQKYLTTRVT